MSDEPSDLREFIRWHTARSDRVLREVMAESARVHREAMARSDAVIAENSRVVAENSRVIDRVIAELDDQRDERRALVAAIMQLIDSVTRLTDRFDRWDPGGSAA